MNKFLTKNILFFLIIIILNVIIVSDYFYHGSKPANFDAIAHVTTIGQFHKALTDGEFPVGWGDGFANYGLPLGTIAHQIPSYMGGFLTFITHDPLKSFNIIYLFAAIVSALFFYLFVKLFVSEESSLLATIFYSLAPYRIMNLYMRGAMPEFFSAVWLPLIFIALYHICKENTSKWYLLFMLSILGLILTHPMMLIVYAPVLGLWALLTLQFSISKWIKVSLTVIFAILLSAYYFFPLNLEDKYLYHGLGQNQYARNQTTTLDSFVNPIWLYNCTYRNDIFGRCHLVKAGLTETIVMLMLFIMCLWILIRHRQKISRYVSTISKHEEMSSRMRITIFVIFGAAISVLFSTVIFQPLYERIRLISNIQYPWRFLSSYLFFPPIALALMFEKIKNWRYSNVIWYVLVIFVILVRFPQLYAKNYTHIPITDYYFTPLNLHSLVMNPIWTGDSREYPVRKEKVYIIRGSGQIISRELKNASRQYVIQADTNLQVSDSTFYFPGWHVYVDGVDTDIQFQDPSYRGVITYSLSPGRHHIRIVYEDTKIRLIGKIITSFSIVALCVWGILTIIKKKFSQKQR